MSPAPGHDAATPPQNHTSASDRATTADRRISADPELDRLAQLIREGHTDQDISALIGLPRTIVRSRVSALMLELGLDSRHALHERLRS